MSDYMPFHIQEEILERLPVKSLIKFRSVSKSWRSFIDSSHFIAAHSRRHAQPEHLLVWYKRHRQPKKKYISLIDDDTFPQQRFVQTLPLSIKQQSVFPRIIGSSHGLLFVEFYYRTLLLLINPCIRKLISILLPPRTPYERASFFLGFGVCPVTLDPKIVYIRKYDKWCNKEYTYTSHVKVMVYTLSSGKWRELSNNNLSSKAIMPQVAQVIIDRFIYWSAFYPPTFYRSYHYLIMSFDMTNESFEVIHLPHTLACKTQNPGLYISKLRDSLVVFESSRNTENQLVLVAWMMKSHDVQRSFTKLYTIEPQHESIMRVVGSRKSGQPIMEVKNEDKKNPSKLVVYEPNLDRFCDLDIIGASNDFLVNSYEETLFLLGRSDCSSY